MADERKAAEEAAAAATVNRQRDPKTGARADEGSIKRAEDLQKKEDAKATASVAGSEAKAAAKKAGK